MVGWRNSIQIGDCIDVLGRLPEKSISAAISSPPYWGLRDYGIPGRVWGGGAPDCQHEWQAQAPRRNRSDADIKDPASKQATNPSNAYRATGGDSCVKCGAWFGSHGLEPDLAMYVAHEVEVLRAIRRVLRDDGVVWWNLGDSYATTNTSDRHNTQPTGDYGKPATKHPPQFGGMCTAKDGLKPLDLCGVPWRVALAAQADGWYLRSAIVWCKGESFNPDRSGSVMPESVSGWRWERHRVKVKSRQTLSDRYAKHEASGGAREAGVDSKLLAEWIDCPGCPKCEANGGFVLRRGSGRPTSSYEMVFLLTKTDSYFYDLDAVREERTSTSEGHVFGGNKYNDTEQIKHSCGGVYQSNGGRNLRNVFSIPGVDSDVWRINTKGFKEEIGRAHV